MEQEQINKKQKNNRKTKDDFFKSSFYCELLGTGQKLFGTGSFSLRSILQKNVVLHNLLEGFFCFMSNNIFIIKAQTMHHIINKER